MCKLFRGLFLCFLCVYASRNFAQQLPQYTQYLFNNYVLNPAITGIENYVDLKTAYRSQWQGIEGAPETGTITLSLPVGKEFSWDNATSSGANGNNPMGRSYIQEYRAAAPHHGFGLIGVMDKIGPISNTYFNLTYAYHLGLAPKLNLSLGVSAGGTLTSLDRSKLNPSDANDKTSSTNISGVLSPDLGSGIWLYSPRFFMGISGQQLLGGSLLGSGSDQGITIIKKVPHFFLMAGYKAFIAEELALIPSVLLKKSGPASLSIDLNTKLSIKDRLWVGASFRRNDSFSGLMGLNISHLLNLGYSYDFTTSELQKVAGGTHEIVLGLLLNNKYRVICPQRNW